MQTIGGLGFHMEKRKLNRILKWLIVIGLISIALLSVYYKYDDCSICKFKINNTEFSSSEFMNLFSSKCLNKESTSRVGLNNLSSSFQTNTSHK